MALWDYLVVTASNAEQASAYEAQLSIRRKLELLSGAREVLVVADSGGEAGGEWGEHDLMSDASHQARRWKDGG